MSIFGAMFSGVSGLNAQSQALGAISDNISNVSTTAYKQTAIRFSTLVTAQATAANYASGGITVSPLAQVTQQGVLQTTANTTDLAMTGPGFFVVNSNPNPAQGTYYFTRAGSFTTNANGYLQNAAGQYLQGWPTDSTGKVIAANPNQNPNQSVLDPNFVTTVQLNNISGAAQPTTTLSVGANLPASDLPGAIENTSTQIFDSLGVGQNINFQWTKLASNSWGMSSTIPAGAGVATILDASTPAKVFGAQGQIQFTANPKNGDQLSVNGTTYTFTTALPGANQIQISGAAGGAITSQTLTNIVTALNDPRFQVPAGSTSTINVIQNQTNEVTINASKCLAINQSGVVGGTYIVPGLDSKYASQVAYQFTALPVAGNTIQIGATTYSAVAGLPAANQFQIGGTISATLANLVTAVGNSQLVSSVGNNLFVNQVSGGGALTVTPTFGTQPIPANYDLGAFTANAAAGSTVTVAGVGSYTGIAVGPAGANQFVVGATLAQTLTNIAAVIPQVTATATDLILNNPASANGTYTTMTTSFGAPALQTQNQTLQPTTPAVTFNGNGTPASIVPTTLAYTWADGASNSSIALTLGTLNQPNGLIQNAGSYSTNSVQQNGTKFGQFTGVTIGKNGLVTATFDNGQTRPIYQLPVATFPNPDGLNAISGNIYNTSSTSGNYLLQTAGNGGTGTISSQSLENSNVDLGTELTNMIIVQRAYSGGTKIITTADTMLNQLLQVQ